MTQNLKKLISFTHLISFGSKIHSQEPTVCSEKVNLLSCVMSVPFSVTVVLWRSGTSRVSLRSWDQCNALHSQALGTRTASVQPQMRKLVGVHIGVKTHTQIHRLWNIILNWTCVPAGLPLTVSRCVRWCLALSLELLKALWHPGCWQR